MINYWVSLKKNISKNVTFTIVTKYKLIKYLLSKKKKKKLKNKKIIKKKKKKFF